MSKAEYKLRRGFHVKGDKQAMGERLHKILKANPDQNLQDDEILQDAEKVSSPLHDHFEWDDTEAAHQHRLDQARYLRGAFEITFVNESAPEETITSIAFMGLKPAGSPKRNAYKDAMTILSDEELRSQLLGVALEALIAWKKKYAHLNELAKFFGAIDDLRDDLDL